jgi:hypothetical protein
MLNSEKQVLILSEKSSHAIVTLVVNIKYCMKQYRFIIFFLTFLLSSAQTETRRPYTCAVYCRCTVSKYVLCCVLQILLFIKNSWSVDSAALHISHYFYSCSRKIVAFLFVEFRPSSELQVLSISYINYDLPKHWKGTVEQDGLSSFWHVWTDQGLNGCFPWFQFFCAVLQWYKLPANVLLHVCCSKWLFWNLEEYECCGPLTSLTFLFESGSPYPFHWRTDPDPAFFFSGWQDSNNQIFFNFFAK